MEFVVRVSANLLRKQSTSASGDMHRAADPFLPPETALTIGDVSPHHIAVLNKFNVLGDHVLVVTRGFVHQESPLTPGDFTAVAAGLQGGAGLAFYNAGRVAGASQTHKHFQLVSLPLGRHADVPMSVLFTDAGEGVDTIQTLRFRHAFGRLDMPPDDPQSFGTGCHRLYSRFLTGLGIGETPGPDERSRLPPYNLLLTARWLLVVPRTQEHYLGVSVNGLGYAGSLFVSSREKREQVELAGPMRFLEEVSLPRA